jgi:hypothetical protein
MVLTPSVTGLVGFQKNHASPDFRPAFRVSPLRESVYFQRARISITSDNILSGEIISGEIEQACVS